MIDNFPESPAAAAWALQALPVFLTGTPNPQKWKSKNQKTTQNIIKKSGHDHETSEEPLLFDREFYRELEQQNLQQSSTQKTPAIQPQQQVSQFRPKDSLRSNLLRKLAKDAVSNTEKENHNPEESQLIRAFDANQPKSLAANTPGAVISTFDTPTRITKTSMHQIQQPASILRTPGTTTAKKAVSFVPDEPGSNVADELATKGLRIRSGLPRHFPGKFPSPWTPKSVIDRLDLADTPTTSYARKVELDMERASKEKEARTKTTEKSHGNVPTSSTTQVSSDRRRRASLGSAEVKQISFAFETLANNTSNLEILLAQKTLADTQRREGRHNDQDSHDASYWRTKFEEAEEERKASVGLLDDIQQHVDNLTAYASAKDLQIVELRQRLEIEMKKRREMGLVVRELAEDMRFLKEKSKEINRKRLKQIASASLK